MRMEIKTFFLLEPKTDTTQQHNWKKGSSSPREASVFMVLVLVTENKVYINSMILLVTSAQQNEIHINYIEILI